MRLVDIRRKTHRNVTHCTWFNENKTIGSRLDKFFIAHDLVPNVTQCEILPCIFPDHDSVDLTFDIENVFSHSPGV